MENINSGDGVAFKPKEMKKNQQNMNFCICSVKTLIFLETKLLP
jgi:hypothetical protein